MANYCNYEIHIKGTKKAALMMFTMIPCLDYKTITHESGTDDKYIVWIEGCCKWSLDSYCKEQPNITIDISKYSEEDVRNEECGLDYWYLTMRQKSEILNLEVLAHSWSEESGYNQMDYYRNGTLISCDYMMMRPDWEEVKNDFDSYQDYCETFNVDPNKNPPRWNRNEYPEYTAFCEAFGLDPETVMKCNWEEEGEGLYFYPNAVKNFTSEFEFEF